MQQIVKHIQSLVCGWLVAHQHKRDNEMQANSGACSNPQNDLVAAEVCVGVDGDARVRIFNRRSRGVWQRRHSQSGQRLCGPDRTHSCCRTATANRCARRWSKLVLLARPAPKPAKAHIHTYILRTYRYNLRWILSAVVKAARTARHTGSRIWRPAADPAWRARRQAADCRKSASSARNTRRGARSRCSGAGTTRQARGLLALWLEEAACTRQAGACIRAEIALGTSEASCGSTARVSAGLTRRTHSRCWRSSKLAGLAVITATCTHVGPAARLADTATILCQ